MADNVYTAIGRRKESTAAVRIVPGSGQIIVNKKSVEAYFTRPTSVMVIEQPLKITETLGNVDIIATCKGGGPSGQAGALRLAISRALTVMDHENRSALKSAGLLRRDPRMVERKKYGQPGARKQFQFSKR